MEEVLIENLIYIKAMLSTNKNMMALAVNKSLLKEYSRDERIVYLKDGDEFQIQLFNPETCTVGAKVFIDNEPMDGLLVMKPGERVWLERYLDESRKFKFSTYEVEDGNAVVENAIRNNGLIKVEFYREEKRKPTFTRISDNSYQPHTYPQWPYSSTRLCSTGDFVSKGLGSLTGDVLYSSQATNCSFSGNISTSSLTGDAGEPATLTMNMTEPVMKETGRTEKGSYSSQDFKRVNMDFENWCFRTETVRILPASQKPITQKDLQKTYCTECGRKLNPKYKFCPYCGTKCE